MRLIVDDTPPIADPTPAAIDDALLRFKRTIAIDTGRDLISFDSSQLDPELLVLTHRTPVSSRTTGLIRPNQAGQLLRCVARGDRCQDDPHGRLHARKAIRAGDAYL